MSWNTPDVYNSPSAFGLEILGTVQWTEQSYDFDMTIVLRSETGKLYWADDQGCSCPSPFENYTSLDKLYTGTLAELEAHLNDQLDGAGVVKNEWQDPWADVADILHKAAQ